MAMRILRRLGRDRAGGAGVEFALIVPVVMVLILGLFEFGRLTWTRTTLQFAAEETGRFAMVNVAATPQQLRDYARGRLLGFDPDAVAVTVESENASGQPFVTILLQLDYMPALLNGLIAPDAIPLLGRARVPLTA